MAGWRRAGSFVVPSVVAAFAAALVAGLLDGFRNGDSALQAFAAAGFFGVYAVPIGLGSALLVRGLWRAWQFEDLVAGMKQETGGAPRLAAWLTYLLAGAWILAAVSFNTVYLLSHRTSARAVVALSTPIIVVAVAALLVFCSRPAVRGLTWALGKLDAATHRRFGRSVLTPRIVAAACGAVVAVFVCLGWIVSIQPRIGHFDLALFYYLGLSVVALVAAHALWPALARHWIAAAAVSAAVAIAGLESLGAAAYVRFQQPYAMLEVWGNTELAGAAIDMMYDIQSLRGELELDEFCPEERPGADHHDVVMITIDTVRADYTPPYGGKAAMPTLVELAHEGAVFQWAFSPGNVTRRSIPTIATGVSPNRMRGRVAGWALRLDPRHVLLAERFRAAGYDTAGFFCCGSHFGPEHRLGLIRGIDHLAIKKDGIKLSEMAHKWLRERAANEPDKPLFVWVHLIEPHLWNQLYSAKDHGSNKGRRYKMSLTASDRMVATVLDGLSDERRDNTFVVVTSDHGEGLGDRGTKFHSTNLYNSQVRVPLVVVGPGIEAKRLPQPVGLVDLAPTLLDLAGYVPPAMPQMDGVSFAALLRGEKEAVLDNGEAYSVMIADRSVAKSARALVVGRYKLIEWDGDDSPELYDLLRDKRERSDLAITEPEVLERMLQRMKARREIDSIPPF